MLYHNIKSRYVWGYYSNFTAGCEWSCPNKVIIGWRGRAALHLLFTRCFSHLWSTFTHTRWWIWVSSQPGPNICCVCVLDACLWEEPRIKSRASFFTKQHFPKTIHQARSRSHVQTPGNKGVLKTRHLPTLCPSKCAAGLKQSDDLPKWDSGHCQRPASPCFPSASWSASPSSQSAARWDQIRTERCAFSLRPASRVAGDGATICRCAGTGLWGWGIRRAGGGGGGGGGGCGGDGGGRGEALGTKARQKEGGSEREKEREKERRESSTAATGRQHHQRGGRQHPSLSPSLSLQHTHTHTHTHMRVRHRHHTRIRSAIFRWYAAGWELSQMFNVCHTCIFTLWFLTLFVRPTGSVRLVVQGSLWSYWTPQFPQSSLAPITPMCLLYYFHYWLICHFSKYNLIVSFKM